MNQPTRYTEEELRARLDDFELAWKTGSTPDLTEFLQPPSSATGEWERNELLSELIMLDLEYRWRSADNKEAATDVTIPLGPDDTEPRSVKQKLEHYIERHPDLGPLNGLPARLAAEEYRVRHRWGDRPSRQEYFQRFGETDSLVEALERTDTQLRARRTPAKDSLVTASGTRIGKFTLLEQLGEGSFGAVWKAHDEELDRLVAVMIPHAGTVTPKVLDQIAREARAAAQLSHPHIVAVHEVVQTEQSAYIVTDLIDGVTLSQWLRDTRPTPQEAARLCLQITLALSHAHDGGVVHRDLKPQNVIVDERGQPHLTDFGLAKREDGELTLTVEGQVLGTPAYMSPEQARGEGHRFDRRTDIYSLGVILFETLTGELPFRGSVQMLLAQIVDDDAPSPRKFDSQVPRDLETICLKCLEKAPSKRYATAHAVAAELERFLQGEPIEARPITKGERVWRWCRRNPILASLSAAVVLLLVTGLLSVTWQWRRETKSARRYREMAYASDIPQVVDALESSNLSVARMLLDRYELMSGTSDVRDWEYYYLKRLCDASPITRTMKQTSVFVLALSPDGNTLAAAGGPKEVSLWDLQAGRLDRTIKVVNVDPSRKDTYITGLSFSADGRTLAIGVNNWAAILYELETERQTHIADVASGRVAFSRTGTLLAIQIRESDEQKQSVLLRLEDSNREAGRIKLEDGARHVWWFAFSQDDSKLAAACQDGAIRIWDTASGKLETKLEGHVGIAYAAAFSPDGTKLISSGWDKTVRHWDIATRDNRLLLGHTSLVMNVDFAPNGKTVASGGKDGRITLWDAATGNLVRSLHGDGNNVGGILFHPNGQSLLSGRYNGVVEQWDLSRLNSSQTTLPASGDIGGRVPLDCSPQGDVLAAVRDEIHVALWDMASQRVIHTFEEHESRIRDIVFSPAQRNTVVASATDNEVLLWDTDSLQVRELAGKWPLAFSPDGALLASGDEAGNIRIWEVSTGKLERTLNGMPGGVGALAFSPQDDRQLAAGFVGGVDRTFVVYNVVTGEELITSRDPVGKCEAVAYSPDGRWIATGGHLGIIRLWDTRLRVENTLRIAGQHSSDVRDLVFSTDGRTLVSSGGDGLIKLWHIQTGTRLLTLEGHTESVESVVFSASGDFLASASADGTIRLWSAGTTGY